MTSLSESANQRMEVTGLRTEGRSMKNRAQKCELGLERLCALAFTSTVGPVSERNSRPSRRRREFSQTYTASTDL